MRFACTISALGSLWIATSVSAQAADTGPDLDFLEYLGAWQADDDEWLVIEEWQRDNGDEEAPETRRRRPDPEQKGQQNDSSE